MPEFKTKPDIRFTGFTDAWEQRKLGDVAEIVGGGTPSTGNPKYWDGEIDWYAPAEMEGQRYAIGSIRKITELGLQNSSAKILPAKKTVLFTSRAGIGKMAILQRSATTNQGFQSLILKDGYDPYFIYSMGDEIKRKAERIASGSTFLEISGKMLGALEIMIPSRPEQERISDCFRRLDDLITLHQREYDKTVNIKKAMLEKMFPKDGEDKPEIRFEGFTDAWEQRKLGDVFGALPNNTLSRADLNHESGKINNIHYGDILVKYGAVINCTSDKIPYITDGEISDYKSHILRDGDVVFADTAEDETVGKAVEIAGIGDCFVVSGLHTIACRPKGKMAPNYLGYYLNSSAFHRQLLPLMQGIKVLSISRANLAKTIISYPNSEKEQANIGATFLSLDHLITLHQRELKKLQNVKKSLLEKMFV